MRSLLRIAVTLVLLAAVMASGHARLADGPPAVPTSSHLAAFYGMGSGPASQVRDATMVADGTIYAVGNGNTLRSGLLWTIAGGQVTQQVLPDLISNPSNPVNGLIASGITVDGQYIASQSRTGPTGQTFQVSRVHRPTMTVVPAGSTGTALALKADGSLMYGTVSSGCGGTRAATYNPNNNTLAAIPLPAGKNCSSTFNHGMSADGTVMVGWGFTVIGGVNQRDFQAFRYVAGSPTAAAIPRLSDGGTWNRAHGVTPDGNKVLVIGNTSANQNGEVYVFDAATNQITELGSPNSLWRSPIVGGLTDDGSVVAVTYSASGGTGNGPQFGYFHNSHGWFQIDAALRQEGIDVNQLGWQELTVQGISGDGRVVWGQGRHNGTLEGFVISFAADYLKDFNPLPQPVANTSIVGAWAEDPNSPDSVIVFMADGSYYQIGQIGFNRGLYWWDQNSGALTIVTKLSTDGDDGLEGANGITQLTVSVTGDTLTPSIPCTTDCPMPVHRIAGGAGSIVGAWRFGDTTLPNASAVIVFAANGAYFMAQDGDRTADPNGRDGNEVGHYTWNPGNNQFVVAHPDATRIDNNGGWGLDYPQLLNVTVTLSADELLATVDDTVDITTVSRVVDPASVVPVITSALTASGDPATVFNYAIAATRALTFDAAPLPSGLTVNTATGQITGTPTVVGAFDVTVSATNTLATGSATLRIQIDSIVCAAGSYLAAPADTACTPAPAGSYVPASGASSATLCPAGTFSDAPGATSCTDAPAGSFVPDPGATSATPCPAGLSSNAGATACYDWTAPVISGMPANIATSPAGSNGAPVTYASPTANDSYDGAVPVICAPSSGSIFPKGTTQVFCTATDAASNSAMSSFYVTVGRQSDPVISNAPVDQTINATSPAGGVFIYPAPTAVDAWGQSIPVTCTPASGSFLPLGHTNGSCNAADADGISASVSFRITVVDLTPPSLINMPAPIVVESASVNGTNVTFALPTAVDQVDAAPLVGCDRASGSKFALGVTTVTCTASDHSGNSSVASFTVTVRDTVAPVVALTKPVAATYRIGQKVTANFTCTDAGSGILSCTGTVADGAQINTAVAGNYTFTVVATDRAGNMTTASVNYAVR